MQTKDIRDVLPTNVKPERYEVTITPFMDTFTFDGSVAITLAVKENTNIIQLNANELQIHEVSVFCNDKSIKASSFNCDAEAQVLSCTFPTTFEAGNRITLHISFSGLINDKMCGFYRSGYVDEVTGEKRFMAGTQFEACDARRAFPCWDEPSLKAVFSIRLRVPEALVALSNMQIIGEKKVDNLIEYLYADTPIVSTYLIAYVVGDLEFLETSTKEGVKVRVYAVKGQGQRGKFALDVASRTLSFFTKYFDCAYPLPKMDLVALPDFAAGAMENWGLVTFRSVYLLFDEKSSSLKTKQNVAYVVGHELAHQWFGNLVTMEWWSDLWLNEGFATWVGWLAADHLFPEWDIWTQFLVDDASQGLHLDCLRSSHPIEVPVRNPSEISQIFDSISYSKGASVIRMLVAYLGEDVFQRGMRAYLRKHQYSNACTADLWAALGEASGKPVKDIMYTWTQQMGFPLVQVQEQMQDGKKHLHVCQHRYLTGADVKPEEDLLWHVPLSIASKNANGFDYMNNMMSKREENITLPSDCQYYKLNHNQTGFYRVLYPESAISKLAEAALKGELKAGDRLGLIADAFAMSSDGYTSASTPLSLLSKFQNETDYLVWGEIASHLSHLQNVWWQQPQQVRDDIQHYTRNLFHKISRKLGFDFHSSDDDKTTLLRALAISQSAKNGDEEIITEALERFKQFIAGDSSRIHPNLRGTIFSLAVKHGKAAEYDAVMKIYEQSSIVDEKLAALAALGSTKCHATLLSTLELTLGDKVRSQDVIYIFRSVALNIEGRPLAWPFVKKHYSFFHDKFYSASTALLSRIISSTTEVHADVAMAEDLESFFKGKQVEAVQRTILQSSEKIRANASYLNKNCKAVAEFLRKALSSAL